MGTDREWKLKSGQMKLEEIEHYGYAIDFFSSIQVKFVSMHVCISVMKYQPYCILLLSILQYMQYT